MSVHAWSECRIAMVDPQTGRALPADHPVMLAATKVFYSECTLAERAAWHRFCCQNSRDPADIAVAKKIGARIEVLAKEEKK